MVSSVAVGRKPQSRRRAWRFTGASLFCLLAALCALPVAAQPESIERIRTARLPVFPETTATPLPWPMHLANSLHHTTRESVIRREILFRDGTPLDSLRLAESERLLRRRALFESVRVDTSPTDSGRVVTIRTQDLWTLSLILSYEKEADLTEAIVGIKESNFLGTGNEVHWVQLISTDQDGVQAGLALPRLGVGRASANLSYSDLSDVRSHAILLGRYPETPFDRWCWSLSQLGARGKQRFFVHGDEAGACRFEQESFSASIGRYTGRQLQTGLGIGWMERRLKPRGEPVSYVDALPPPPAFEARQHSGPLLHAAVMKRHFCELTNLDRYGVVEDLPVGWSTQITIGPNLRDEEDPERAFATQGTLAFAAFPLPRVCTSFEATGAAFFRHDRTLGERVLRGRGTIAWQPNSLVLSIAQVSARTGADQPPTSVGYLGAETGLRGFPSREFEVRDYLLATLEQRVWSGVEILWTGIGGNLFVNAALPSHAALGEAERWRTGIGLGLLLGLRKRLQPPLRFEIAWRTDRPDDPTLTVSMQTSLPVIPAILWPSPTFRFAETAQ